MVRGHADAGGGDREPGDQVVVAEPGQADADPGCTTLARKVAASVMPVSPV